MEIKHNDILITENNPFDNCQLERKRYADILTSIITHYRDGFVLALNGEWGTGKTTFVRMWQQDLINKGFGTLYFNAWENDLQSDPMIAILGEFKKLLGEKDDTNFKKVLQKGAIVSKNVLPGVAKAIVKKYVDVDDIAEAVANSVKATTEIFSQEVNEYSKKKEELDNFRISLSQYVFDHSEDKPIVFVIDELDRCRPDYAVEVLEKVKHFFSVRGIVFVLAIDKEQLGNSIKGYYGSDYINSEEYLRRFIDIEYRLPEPSPKQFCHYLYSYFDYDKFFATAEREQYFGRRNEAEEFLEFATRLVDKQGLTLRQTEKLFSHSRVALYSFQSNQFLSPGLFFFLIFLKTYKPNIYNKLINKKYAVQELADEVDFILELDTPYSSIKYKYIELITLYARYVEGCNYLDLLYDRKTSELFFNTRIKDQDYTRKCIDDIRSRYHDYDILNHLLQKINLYSDLVL